MFTTFYFNVLPSISSTELSTPRSVLFLFLQELTELQEYGKNKDTVKVKRKHQ